MNRYTVSILSLALVAFAILFGLAWAGPPAIAGISPAATPITIDVDLPSDSTGTPGGTLALRILAPASAGDARYADGAPVLIYVPGGTGEGSLRPQLLQADDVIRIVFLFPGGYSPPSGRRSDGTYDYRGPNSIAALRDVIRYAAGELTDGSGNTIDDVVPVPVLHEDIGLLGSSNGGNIVIAVAAQHGADLAGHLRYIVQWESPVSSQIATADLGGIRLDCPGGRQEHALLVNPRYRGYGPLELDVDYSQLAYDPSDPLHPVFWDGNSDGHYTTILDPSTGCRTPDLDLDGTLELSEDFPLRTDGAKQSYSRPATQALANQNTFAGSWPSDIATPAEADVFWDLREAVRFYPDALTNIPNLEGMVLTSVVDHVQSASDKPHIRQAFDGWLDLSGSPPSPLSLSWQETETGVQGGEGEVWVKINPARDYVLEVDPSLSSRTDLPDNAANTAPADWTDAGSYAFPDGLEEVYFAAAAHEMADRAHAASATLTSTPSPTATLSSPSTPTPPTSQCVHDVNGNGVGDVVDIQATASDLPCQVYLPLVAAQWRRPWPTDTPTVTPTPTPSPTPTSTPTASADLVITIGDRQPGASIKPLLGVNVGPVPAGAPGNADLTTGYQQIGVNAVRTHDFYGPLDMAVMYPDWTRDPSDPNSYNFEESDAVFAAILNGGFEPYLRLGDSWNNATPPSGPVERANWVQAAVEVMHHYREGQWGGFSSDLYYVEIWNEPDNLQFWPRPHTRLEFFQVFADTANALKAAFPNLMVGGPGLTPAGFKALQGRQYAQDFLDYMQNHSVPLDFFSWHMYSNDPADFVDAAVFYRDLLDSKGYATAESHITEWNTAVNAENREDGPALRMGAQGAALMTAAWIGLQEQDVDVSLFYRGTDASLDNPTWYGMFFADGRPKRIALAFSLWSDLATHAQRLGLSTTPARGSGDRSLWMLAGQNAAGEIALLIANPNDAATSWRLAFADGRDLSDYTVTVKEVSDASNEIQIVAPEGPIIEIGAYTVQLVLLKRGA